jgi:hypothetical protein
VRNAIHQFYDSGLDERVRRARWAREDAAQQAFIEHVGAQEFERRREQAEAKREALLDLADEINGLWDDVIDVDLPEPPPLPDALPPGPTDEPLVDSEWDYAEATRRLKAYRAYEEDV